MRRLSILLAVLGLLLLIALVAWADVGEVTAAVLSVGWDGFALLLLWQAGLFAILGLAWRAVLPGAPLDRCLGVVTWGRMVRDGATVALPFSPVGGYVFGARAATLAGLPGPRAAASTLVDVTAEILAQGLFALCGLLIVLRHQPDSGVVLPLALGLGAAAAGAVLLVRYRRRLGGLVRTLGEKLAGNLFTDASARLDQLGTELAHLTRHPGRFAAAVALHTLAWLVTGGATWLTFRMLGHPVDFVSALAIEAVVHAMVGAAFLVPGGAGVQEAGYAGLGALFGIPPELAVGASLLRRAREAAWAIPVLLAWQLMELRQLRASRGGAQPQRPT